MFTRTASVLMAMSLAAPASLVAQHALPVTLEIGAGYMRSTTDLGRTAILESRGYVVFGEPPPTGTLSVGAVVDVSDTWSARLTLDHATSTEVAGQWFCDLVEACPAVLILVGADLRRWTVGADLAYRPSSTHAIVEPVIFVGAGVRHHRLRWESPNPEVPIPSEFDETDLVVRLGLGASRDLGLVSLFGEARLDLGEFGSGEERSGPHTVPDGRVLNVDAGVSFGVRVPVR